MDETEMVQELERFLGQLVARDEFSGSVLVAKETQPLFKKGYGLASQDFNIPNHAETKFHLASLSKVFTSVAVAQLAEQGALSFQDPVSQYLTDYPRDIAEKVTIHHLLTHTSGMGDCFTEQFWSTPREHFRTVQDWLPLFSGLPLAFQPGERWSYSNAGFVVLGAVIEQVSKQSYFDYLRDHIYKPAMMSNTDAYEMDQPVLHRAIGYTYKNKPNMPESGSRKNNTLWGLWKGNSAGGLYSTVDDLFRFALALQTYKLLSVHSTQMLLTGKVRISDGSSTRYAYGFFEEIHNGTRIVGHPGGAPGISTQLDLYLKHDYTVVVLSNYDGPAAEHVAYKLREMMT